jgi:hypothetical protein
MATKKHNVDSIVAPVSEANVGRIKETDQPLLSIIEPEVSVLNPRKQRVKKSKPKNKDVPEKQPINKPSMSPKSHHKIFVVVCGVLATIIILTALIGGGMYAQQSLYENKVFPGVVVWGEDVGGKSVTEVQQQIAEKVEKYQVTIKGPDQDYVATAVDLGVNFSSDSMALGAYSRGRSSSDVENYLTRVRLLSTRITWAPWQKLIRSNDLAISPSYIVDEEKLSAYLTEVSSNIDILAQDSEVNVASGQVTLKPAIYGRKVNADELRNQIKKSVAGFSTEEILVQTVSLKPAIIDDAAQEVMIRAQNVMKRPVILTYQGVEYRPNQETIASWISFVKNTGDTNYTLTIDTAKMKSYFDYLGTKINIYSVSRKVRVENGVKETEINPGKDGTLVDTLVLGKSIASQLSTSASVTVSIPTYVSRYKTVYERVVIADWEKYIDINLSSQLMTACEKGGVNCRQWSVTTGKNGTATPTGTFLILGRSASFYMTGGTPGIDYYKVWVDHAVWFTSAGHAIHDAAWRNGSFGGQDYTWNGSHGCINSPDEAAIFVYNWAPVGTPVIVHY